MDMTEPAQSPTGEPPVVREHLARLDPAYEETFLPAEILQHALMAERLDPRAQLVELAAVQAEDGAWRVTIVAYDYLGALSLICGLMLANGLNILGGEVFTYEPVPGPGGAASAPAAPGARDVLVARLRQSGRPYLPPAQPQADTRRKIVDVFTVAHSGPDELGPDFWERYRSELAHLLALMQAGQRREARGELANRVGGLLQETPRVDGPLNRVNVEFDNNASANYTLLAIDAPDTMGFLYELTNALAYSRTNIVRMTIESIGDRVRDTLYVTDDRGQKITDAQQQRELRAAIVLIKQFTHLLPNSPHPAAALLHFREFIAQLFLRPNWPDELTSLERPEVLDGLARLLGVSDFLWDDFLRMQYANLYPVVRDVDALAQPHSREALQRELELLLAETHPTPQPPDPDAPWVTALNAFKDREMFRIDMRQILGHTVEFSQFSEELTDLAEVVLNAAFHLAGEDLRSVYGTPRLPDGVEAKATVCALGKCGGRELGFASDIELMIIYTGNGTTDGPLVISAAEYFEKLVTYFVRTIRAKHAGIFEIDLQLRPYGKAGSLAVSLEAFRRYFSPTGPAWAYERQALVRLRRIAGDEPLGQHVEELRDSYVYAAGAFNLAAMRAMRERQIRHLVTAGTFHPKFSPGGLVDVEYLVQGLQMMYGRERPELQTANTRTAMQALHTVGLLPAEDYTHLRKAHTFLRWLIESLRVVSGSAKDIQMPAEASEEFAFLAQRMRYGKDTQRLLQEMRQYAAWVQEINARLLKEPPGTV